MKNISISLILCLLIVVPINAQPSWHIVTVDSDGYEGYGCSLSLDSFNIPHIVYSRQYTTSPFGYDLKYAYYDNNNWNISVIIYATAAYDESIAMDSNNKSHISFYYYDAPDSYVCYANNVSGVWQISNVDQNGTVTTIAVDSLNHPHIAYSDDGWYGLKYAHFDGNTWIIQVVDSQQQSGSGNNNAITTDSPNNPHISYCQDAIGQLRYAHKVSGSWVIEYPDSVTGSMGSGTSICLNSQDLPCISHGSPLHYCSKIGGTWQVQQVDSSGGGTSLALNSNDYPYIAYSKDSPNNLLYMAHWDGSTWQLETVDPTPGAGMHCSLKLDSSNRPHIAYQMNYAYDLMYAWYGEGGIGVTLSSFTAQSTSNGIKLNWQATNSGSAQLAGFNLYRVDTQNDPEKNYLKLNSNLITGNSLYSFLDSTAKSGVNYQYHLWALYTNGSREEVGTTEGHSDSIKPAAFSLLAVYPNPAKSLLTCRLSLSQAGSVNLSLYDISGRLVLSRRMDLPSGEQDISVVLGKLAKGVYTVQIESGGEVRSKRIVISR